MTIKKVFQAFTKKDIPNILQKRAPNAFTHDELENMRAVATILPFRVNNYVLDELINWNQVPRDPIFTLSFPQPAMLEPHFIRQIHHLNNNNNNNNLKNIFDNPNLRVEKKKTVDDIRFQLRPHPSNQVQLNKPHTDSGCSLEGMQHKYHETLLFFPSQAQYCHTYCTYCFRWAQFVGIDPFRSRDVDALYEYVEKHKEITDILFTGGDAGVLKANHWRLYLEPLLKNKSELSHIKTIRIGTKSLAWWPYRWISDEDANETLEIFNTLNKGGRHVSIMAHFSHPSELKTTAVEIAIKRLQEAGCIIRTQAPLIRHINDDASIWAEMWKRQTNLGCIPYYMFVERQTGASRYFELPLITAHKIYSDAVSGLSRTVRGPVMSATPGKIQVLGKLDVGGKQHLAMQFIQARVPSWCHKVFLANYDENACWIDSLTPSDGEFFFQKEMDDIQKNQ